MACVHFLIMCGFPVLCPEVALLLMTLFLTLNAPFPSPDGDNFHCGRESPPVARRREFCCRREFLLPLPDSVALEAPPPIAWRQ